MKKSLALSVSAGIIVLGIVSAWLVNIKFSDFQTQITELQTQNRELQNQIIALQNQTQLTRDRIIQLLEQTSENYKSPVQITEYNWIGGFNPYVCLTLMYPVNVTIHNNGATDARGLSIGVKLINLYDGSQIGISGGRDIGTLLSGETREIQTGTYASLDESLADAVCVLTLKQGDTIVDEWIRSIAKQ